LVGFDPETFNPEPSAINTFCFTRTYFEIPIEIIFIGRDTSGLGRISTAAKGLSSAKFRTQSLIRSLHTRGTSRRRRITAQPSQQ